MSKPVNQPEVWFYCIQWGSNIECSLRPFLALKRIDSVILCLSEYGISKWYYTFHTRERIIFSCLKWLFSASYSGLYNLFIFFIAFTTASNDLVCLFIFLFRVCLSVGLETLLIRDGCPVLRKTECLAHTGESNKYLLNEWVHELSCVPRVQPLCSLKQLYLEFSGIKMWWDLSFIK